jgi:uncharacterized damage-inducible protein DinB
MSREKWNCAKDFFAPAPFAAKSFIFNGRRFHNFLRATLRVQERPMNSPFCHSPTRHAAARHFLTRHFPGQMIATLAFLRVAFATPTFSQQIPPPTAAELSVKETVASAFLRSMASQEYEVRSAAEAMPEELYTYRPAEGKFKNEKPEVGPAEVRTFAEQVKHVACSNLAFAAELNGEKPPVGCDKGGPDPAKTKCELLIYLRNSFAAVRKSFTAINAKNQFDPIEGPYAGPNIRNIRRGLAVVVIWHNADHYGQMVVYLRLNGIVPAASWPTPPPVKDTC